MAELIFAEQTLAFEFLDGSGLYIWNYTGDGTVFVLVEGQTYTVLWDGTPYFATAKEMTLDGVTGVGLGNEGIVGIGEDNDQPFLFAYVSDYSVNACYSTAEGDTHTVAIYKGVMTAGANIVLYDRNGEPVTYEGIETVSFNTDVEGEVATYYLDGGNTAEGVSKEVELNLADGDQTVEADPDTLMSEVIIKKPVTLLPENIAEGVEIAGVTGTFEGGGNTAEGISKEVELNLADGDQTVKPDANTLLSEVIIKKPDTLLPENIAKNVEIAGIVGTHESGGGVTVSVSPSDINFYDYDGTIVAAWTLEELAAATALPENPQHSGLISQGWNWTLTDLKTTNRPMNVGQMYITDDGKTRLYIRLTAEGRMTVPLYFSQTVENGVTIDWGDGSGPETLTGTGNMNPSHTYAGVGEYVISLAPVEGCALGLGTNSSGVCVVGGIGDVGRIYSTKLKKVEIGNRVTSIGNSAFYNAHALESITIPSSVTSIDANAFSAANSLESVTIPSSITSIGSNAFYNANSLESVAISLSVTSIGSNAFYNAYALESITIPSSVTSIGSNAFRSAYPLPSVTIPSSVISIGENAFRGCSSLAEVHVKNSTPPTLGSSAFSTTPSDCIFYVPKGCLSAYQSATNWSTYKSKMQEETE